MPKSMSAHARLHTFMGSLPRQRDTYAINLLRSSLGAWRRYYDFLEVVRSRHDDASTRYSEAIKVYRENLRRETWTNQPSSHAVIQVEWLEIQCMHEITQTLHLDIESFYMFANSLLDRIASTFNYYFGQKPKWNHKQLIDNLEKTCKKRRLVIAATDALTIANDLQRIVVEYRNKRIEHVLEPRFQFITIWGSDRKAKIYPMLLYPREGEVESFQNPTHDLDEILDLIGRYIIAMLDFFDANADKSMLPREQTNGE